MSSSDPIVHKRIGRGVRNADNAVWDRVREDAVLAGNFANFSQNPTTKQHLLSTGTKRLAEASPFHPVWGIGLREDDLRAHNPRRWPGIFCSEKLFLPSATPFAPVSPGWQPTPPGSNSALRPHPAEFRRFPQRHLALWLWPALAQVLLRSFRPVLLMRRWTTTPRSSATPFAPVSPGWQPTPPGSNSALRPHPAEFRRFPQRHLALWLWPALAQVLLRSFRPVLLMRRWTTTPRS